MVAEYSGQPGWRPALPANEDAMKHGKHEDPPNKAETPEREASEECISSPLPKGRTNGEHHGKEAEEPSGWQPIESCPKIPDAVYLVWDDEFVEYPVAAFWYCEPIYKKVGRNRTITGRKPGYWRCVEDELQNHAWPNGGLVPSRWLPWKKPEPA